MMGALSFVDSHAVQARRLLPRCDIGGSDESLGSRVLLDSHRRTINPKREERLDERNAREHRVANTSWTNLKPACKR